MTWAVIATGESLNPPGETAARVRHLPTIAVGNAYTVAPWAKALVACDRKWWDKHPEATGFRGEKWSANAVPGVRRICAPGIYTNTNSGLLGLHLAVEYGARRVLLLGVDMKGTHYFGRYKNGCANTQPSRFHFFIRQFEDYAKRLKDVEVINCSTEGALNVFPKMSLDDALSVYKVAA